MLKKKTVVKNVVLFCFVLSRKSFSTSCEIFNNNTTFQKTVAVVFFLTQHKNFHTTVSVVLNFLCCVFVNLNPAYDIMN